MQPRGEFVSRGMSLHLREAQLVAFISALGDETQRDPIPAVRGLVRASISETLTLAEAHLSRHFCNSTQGLKPKDCANVTVPRSGITSMIVRRYGIAAGMCQVSEALLG